MGISRPDWSTELVPAEPAADLSDPYAGLRDLAEQQDHGGDLLAGDGGDLPAALTAKWAADPAGADFRLATAQASALGVLEALDQGDRAIVEASFSALPATIRTAVLGELSLGSTGAVRNATAESMDIFAGSPVGAILTNFWKGATPRNLGRCQARIKWIDAELSMSDADELRDWLNDQPPRAAVAVMSLLAA